MNTAEKTTLTPEDHEKFFAAMDAPAKPVPALVSAIQRYHARVLSR